jgi:hypothetical protein
MRDKIAGFLERAGRPLPAEQILREVLNIRSPNAFAAERVLKGILGGDARFMHRQGLWRLVTPAHQPSAETAALDLQWRADCPQFYRGAIWAEGAAWEFASLRGPAASDIEPLREARRRVENRVLLGWSAREMRLWNRLLRLGGLQPWYGDFVPLDRLAARVMPQASSCRHPEDLAAPLSLPSPDLDRPAGRARFLAAAFQALLDLIPAAHRGSPGEIARWIAGERAKIDYSRFAFGREFIARLPESPGVYLMRDRAGEVIYVGKAANLKRRVRSYFTARAMNDPKVARIHGHLYSLEILTCTTEVDALLLEMRMIRDFRPSINLQEEIHERPSRYGRELDLLLLVPAGEKVEIFFVRDGSFQARRSVALGSPPSGSLRARIRTVYSGERRRRAARKEAWEVEIVARWFAANRKRLNFIDVDEAGGADAAAAQLASFLKDPDRLAGKVYYRR